MSRQRIFHLMILLVLLSFTLAACERPIEDGSDAAVDTTSEVSEAVSTESSQPPEVAAEATAIPEAAAEESTPRLEPSPEAEASESAEAASSEPETPIEESGESDSADDAKADDASAEEPTEETAEETAEAAEPSESRPSQHEVAAGETLYTIGLKYNLSWVTLAEFNGLDDADQISAGMTLAIPSDDELADPGPGAEPTPSPMTETTYTVIAGDNLFRIGLIYGTNWVQIAEANGLVNPNQVYAGQVLKIPVNTPGPTPQFTHEVKPGETLFSIALQYGVAWPLIAEANEMDSPYVIYTGQTLVIPGG